MEFRRGLRLESCLGKEVAGVGLYICLVARINRALDGGLSAGLLRKFINCCLAGKSC